MALTSPKTAVFVVKEVDVPLYNDRDEDGLRLGRIEVKKLLELWLASSASIVSPV